MPTLAPLKSKRKENKVRKSGRESIRVRMRMDLPEIAGIDGRVYGPFEAGDDVVLPYMNGKAFVNHGDAVEISA